MDTHDTTKITVGIDPSTFDWKLDAREAFQTPEAVMVYSENSRRCCLSPAPAAADALTRAFCTMLPGAGPVTVQYGTSMCYPISSIGSHVSVIPNHQVFRNTPLHTRANVAYFGSFGYELMNLGLLTSDVTASEVPGNKKPCTDFKSRIYALRVKKNGSE